MRISTVVLLGSVLVVSHVGDASAVDRFVSRAGDDTGNDCTSAAAPCLTLARALATAVANDAIEVAGGLGAYHEGSLAIASTTTLTVSGAWAPDFSSRDLAKRPTTFANGSLALTANSGQNIDLTLDGVRLSKTPVDVMDSDGSVHLAVVDCRFSGLGGIFAAQDGGSMIDIDVTRSTFTGNKYPRAAIEMDTDNSTGGASIDLAVHDSAFSKNHWGAISFLTDLSGNGSLSVERSSFLSNKGIEGGAILARGFGGTTTIDVTNSFFFRDATGRAPRSSVEVFPHLYGGAVAIEGNASATADLVNDTIVDNRASGGGGLLVSGDPTVHLENDILWHNKPDDVWVGLYSSPGPVVDLDHDDVGLLKLYTGTVNDLGGNQSADPQLTHGFELTSGSAMVDAGNCSGAPSDDIQGDPRPSGSGCDIGADELVP